MLRADGDGRISLGDLDATLSRVAVCCPKTRCIYRCRSHMAERLHSKVATDHGCVRGWPRAFGVRHTAGVAASSAKGLFCRLCGEPRTG